MLCDHLKGWDKGVKNRQSREDFSGSENILYDTIMVKHVFVYFFKTTKCAAPRVKPHINYGTLDNNDVSM